MTPNFPSPQLLAPPDSPAVLLSPMQMGEADRAAVAAGVPSLTLMANAGAAVAREIENRFPPRPVVVLCGPGNNGGDGFVAAARLRDAGWPVSVALLGDAAALSGDAAHYAAEWGGAVAPLAPACLAGAELVVDAVFGAGLNRPLAGVAAETLAAASAAGLPIVAVDVPSGVDGATGQVRGAAVPCVLTVTFFRLKPGHKLLPGRDLCGAIAVADIGIPAAVCGPIDPHVWVNHPGLWRIPQPGTASHKYSRGHVLIVGGALTGATRLATRAARRIGAGLATIVCPPATFPVFAADAPGALVLCGRAPDGEDAFQECLADPRRNAVLIGPGHGTGPRLRQRVHDILRVGRPCVLDADALAEFANDRAALFDAIRGPCILTPHAGEFARLFPDLRETDRLNAARAAAMRTGAVVLLKGSDTVIAAPDGDVAINDNAPPYLATGGSGDVLAGFAAGLLGLGMPPLAAAAAAAWVHGEAARRFGPGLIAEDLPEGVPMVLRDLWARRDA